MISNDTVFRLTKEKGYVKGLDNLTEDDNPIVVVAKLKNSDK